MRAIKFVINVVIGILATVATIPIILASMICMLGGSNAKAEWLLDHTPLDKWFNHLNI
jgi:uncharacterized membrane protein YbaN (DUF454 family)